MKIKICGLMSLNDIDCVNEAMPDFIGFIFASKSKRKISFEQAFEMKKALNNNIKSVGVFVDEKIENITYAVNNGLIDLIQLHGKENKDYIKELRTKVNNPIIKAFKADDNLKNNINAAAADYVLIDSINETSFGGTGKTFDWGIIPETDKKIFLAGGLNAQNILKAINMVHPYCVDINSGVETNGRKDKNKITEIIQIIKGYGNE